MKIRFAKPEDVKAIQGLVDVFYFAYTTPLLKTIKRKRVLVTQKGNKIIGVVIYGLKEKKVNVIVINEDYRGKGLGKKLLKKSFEIFKVKKMKIMATEDPTNSVPFWKKMGFYPLPKVIKTKRGNKLRPMIYIKED